MCMIDFFFFYNFYKTLLNIAIFVHNNSLKSKVKCTYINNQRNVFYRSKTFFCRYKLVCLVTFNILFNR